jgi:hypothetical protein
VTDTAAAPAPAAPTVDGALVELVKVLQKLQRPDLITRASAAASRLKRPSTIVCVVGEFKQGKSSLVNALLGHNVCPVDDDLATSAITLVRYGDEAGATVHHVVDGQQVAEPIAITDLDQWVSESGNPGNAKGVERVEIAVPSPLLKQGLIVVDTPGMGGLGAGHAATTLGFLPFADGLVFVSDASAELSAPEIDFLHRATELCPTVMFAMTKIDLYPEWKRIMELDRGHLERSGIKIPMVSVSSFLRAAALARKDRELNELSQIPEVVRRLGEDVVAPAKANAAVRSAADALSIATQVRAGLMAERAILADPASAQEALATMEKAKSRIEFLRGPGAKWNQVVGDGIGDLSTTVNYTFRSAMRTISRTMDERIELLAKADEWDELTRYIQTVVADQVAEVFVSLEQGRDAIRAEVVELLGEENLQLGESAALSVGASIEDLWRGKALDEQGVSGGKRAFGKATTTIKGAQSGIMMFGTVAKFIPLIGHALALSNPVTFGVGAIFGGMGLMDEKKRKIAARRQSARSQVRQFSDDVQFEVGNQIGNVVKDIQRELRDEFGDRLTELLRTYTETATRAQQDGQKNQQERQQRIAEIDVSAKTLGAIEAFLVKVVA